MNRKTTASKKAHGLGKGGRKPASDPSLPTSGSPSHSAGTVTVLPLEVGHPTVLRPYQKRWANDPARFAIAVKSAQIGFSTATAAWAVERCLRIPRRNVIFLSRSERQSRELSEKAKMWLDGYHGVVSQYYPDQKFEGAALQHEIRFPNGSRIIVLAANPDTARGYTGDVVLDEFAFHQDSQSIFTAVYRQVSLGYDMRVLSTPNGPQGKFYELARSLGLDSGVRPLHQPVCAGQIEDSRLAIADGKTPGLDQSSVPKNPWSGHWVDAHLAVEEGCQLDLALVRGGCDAETWLQEYCCHFVSSGSTWISPDLFEQCVSSEASVSFVPDRLSLATRQETEADDRRFYAGWDIARNHDLSVIWLNELVGDVSWTRGVVEMRDMPTPQQVREARSLMPFVRRMEIDKGGMGLAIYESLARDFPDQVEGVQFTSAKKEAMAVLAKRRMEDSKIRLPGHDAIRQSFRSVRKTVNVLGQARFDAEHDSKFGHADHWWAFCMAEAAASQQPPAQMTRVAAVVGMPEVSGMLEVSF